MTRLLNPSTTALSAFHEAASAPLRALLAGTGQGPPLERVTQWTDFEPTSLVTRLLAEAGGEAAPVLMTLFPAVHLAWVDGEADDTERRHILQAAWELDLDTHGPGWQHLEGWLRKPPPLGAAILFTEFADTASRRWSAQRYAHWQAAVLELTRAVAEASGGSWLASPVSPPEAAWLESLEWTLDPLK